MNEISVSRRIAAPSDRVWTVITDLERSPEVISGIDAVEITAGSGFAVGTTWSETRTMFGKTVTEQMEVTSVDPGAAYVVESDSRGTHYVSEFTLRGDGPNGCVLTMSFRGEPGGTVSKVFASTVGKLFESGTRKAIEQDLADIATAAEAH